MILRSAFFSTLLCACAASPRPPALEEVPIRDNVPLVNRVATGDDAPAPDTDRAAMASTKSAPPDAGSDAGGKKSLVGAPECKKLIKRFADFVMKDANQPPVDTNKLEENPIFGQMLDQCQQETTKKQYDCGMAAKNRGAWEGCMK
jgi:hypothetical protein